MKFKILTVKIVTILIVGVLLSTFFPVGIFAAENIASSTDYSFNVYVPKNTVGDISFYHTAGFDEENRDFFNEDDIIPYILDSDTDKKYDIYTMRVKEGTYSFRAVSTDRKSLGGGIIKVPAETVVDIGEKNEYEVNAYLRLSKTYITNKYDNTKAEVDDFSVALNNKLGTVTMGEAFTDEKGYACYPALIYANGNALLYYVTATPSEEYGKAHNVKEERQNNIAVFKGDRMQSFKLELPEAIPFTIVAPQGAEVFMYDQIMNFNTVQIEPVSITDNDDGTSDFNFAYAGESYRVSMEGKRTQVGYIQKSGIDETVLNVTFPDGESNEQAENWLGRKESSVLLNINERNRLSMNVGESYKVRAYRAAWQIVNNDTDNIMIEPDFHYNVLSGDDVIDINQTDGGNAGGNWAEITAKKRGVAILEVSFDAMDVAWSDKTELYGATNPRRTGVFVVAVGEEYGDVSGVDIDAEYYTHYFTGDSGVLTIEPQGSEIIVEVANVWQGKLGIWENVKADEESFDVPIVNGNNILKITADGVTDFRVIRGSQLKPVIKNKTHPEHTESVYPGDELTISFEGLFQWIPKFAGIYNPSRLYAVYHQGENIIESVKSQYNLPETTIDVKVDSSAAENIVLRQGKLTGNSLGSKWSAHRQLTDGGVPANFNASYIPLDDIGLPDLIIPIEEVIDDGITGDGNYGVDDEIFIPDGGDDGVNESDNDKIDTSGLQFDILEDEIKGFVTVSFEDYGKRRQNESGVIYKNPLGRFIEPTSVPFKEADTVASVTLRLLKAMDIKATYSGNETNNFYLSAIGNFTLGGEYYDSFGEFSAGAASGWMVKHNNWLINMGAAEFEVEDGDCVEWLYTCSLGADIGCDWSNPSAEILGLTFKADYGTLYPPFDKEITEYTYTVSSSVNEICLKAEPENYWAIVTYNSDGKAFKPMEAIQVSDGTVINIESSFAEFMGHKPTETDSFKIVIRKENDDYSDSFDSDFEEIIKAEVLTKEEVAQPKIMFSENTFADVKKDDWYYDAVKYVYENNLMQGTDIGFEANVKMSRAMLVTVLYRMVNPDNNNNSHSFSDVLPGVWYTDAVSWASSNGIIKGISETKFYPDGDVTREQMALIFYRFVKMQGYSVRESVDNSAYTDEKSVSDWACDAVRWATKTGLLNGTSKTTFSPKDKATRAQVAAILSRFCENIKNNQA